MKKVLKSTKFLVTIAISAVLVGLYHTLDLNFFIHLSRTIPLDNGIFFLGSQGEDFAWWLFFGFGGGDVFFLRVRPLIGIILAVAGLAALVTIILRRDTTKNPKV